ncbi:hypothetical protein SH1V18_27490 [Vallitalea longa]|uniref:histidine kinase n=1 Tax=Vallitalea longa TaxID=2936439 RepID=A0A9W5YBW2_9FIRM|nr:HAMP domain-containing sensor histidine kinase [Vallitalea longa]GKX30269.1 hypothetical protein SH1V18_27490 [Vallitalea longa]
MKTNKKRLGFFGIIVRNFIVFAIAVLAVLLFACFLGILVIFFDLSNNYNVPIDNNKKYFVEGDYDTFPIERILGEKGYFVVYDEYYDVIYKSKSAKDFNLSKDQVILIPDAEDEVEISRTEYIGKDNKKYISVLYSNETVDNDNNLITSSSKIIADSNFNIMFSDNPNIKNHYTESEFNLLIGQYQDKLSISKLSYTGNDGNDYCVVLCKEVNDDFKSSRQIIRYIVYGYIIFFIFAVLFFVRSLYKKVKEPLILLNDAIDGLAENKTDQLIKYTGPREFEEICHSFNDMAIKLNETDKKRVAAEEQKQKMLADISHDLKTPITVIKGYAKAITDKKVNEKELSEYLNTIYKKSNSLAELINTFSEYSKLERPDFKIKPTKTNICEFARNYFIDKYNELEFLGFELDIQISDESIYCMVDVFEMKRVFENIISNTVKYNEKGKLIAFTLKKTEGNCIIHIGDNGVGIPDDLKKSIFNPFSMGDSSRSEGKSSGLGMAIVEKIIIVHKGTIKLLENPVHGLNVVYEITLPLIEEE